jgi:WD40 repeat protein
MTAGVDVAGLSATACVRVLAGGRDGTGEVVGSGFLVGPDLVATCAHVVAAAIGTDPYALEAPDATIELDFPTLPGPPVTRTGRVHRWVPIGADGSGDVALIRLDAESPAGAVMPPLRRVERLWDSRFRVFGFPEGRADGVWATGRVRGEQGTGWYQLQGDPGDQPIEGGFSGAPVWDDRTAAVIGMTVAADRDPDVTTAYLLPVQAVLGLDPELLPCPYRGLEPFEEEHAGYFFGRDPEVGRLAEVLRRRPLVAVAGPSGAGKSSLIKAGLLPRLRDQDRRVVEFRPRPGTPPLPALVSALLGPSPASSCTFSALIDPDRRAQAIELLTTSGSGPTVLVVDQFEELADTEPEAARQLLDVLAELTAEPDPPRVMLTVRGIALSEVVGTRNAELLAAGSVFVGPLDRARLRDVIVRPAEQAPGLAFEDGLVDRILDDAGAEPGQLTLVESLLTQLWTRRSGGTLTVAGYEQAGGVAGALTAHAERVVQTILDDGGDPDRLRELLTRLVITRQGRFVRHPTPLDQLPTGAAALVPALAAARLVVVTEAQDGSGTAELAHQALVEHWPRLREWLEADREFLGWRTDLDAAVHRWENQGRDEGALLRGAALDTAVQRTTERPGEVSPAQADFVRRGHDRQRREVRRWRTVTAVLAVLVLLAGGLALTAISSGHTVRDQLRAANASLVADAALARAPTDPAAATQLALTAWRLDPSNPNARTALARQYLAMRSVEAVIPVNDDYAGGFSASADGDVILTGNNRAFSITSGVRSGDVQKWDPPGVPAYQGTRLSFDGRWLLVIDSAGAVWVWDVRERRGPDRLAPEGHPADPSTVIFSADSERVSWLTPIDGLGGRRLEIWRPGDRTAVAHNLGTLSEPAPRWAELTADPNLVLVGFRTDASASPDKRMALRSLADGTTVREFPPGGQIAGLGAYVVSCTAPAPGGPETATLVVTRPEQGVESLRFPLLGRECSYGLTTDDQHVIERRGAAGDGGYDLARITALADGRSFELTAPPNALTDMGRTPDPVLFFRRFHVATGPGEGRTVIMPQVSSIQRLRAEPAPVPPAGSRLFVSGGREILAQDGRGDVSVVVPETGEIVHRMPRTTFLRPQVLDTDRGMLAGVLTDDARFFLADHTLPGITRTATFAMPGGTAAARRLTDDKERVVASESRVVAVDAGVLYAWDRATGELLRPPLNLVTDEQSRSWFARKAGSPHLQLRPGHPDELAMNRPDGSIEIWNIREGIRVSALPLPGGHTGSLPVFSPDGATLATTTHTQMLAVMDLKTAQLVRPLIPLGESQLAVGFTADGYIATSWYHENEQETGIVFWDLRSGRAGGELRVRTPPHDIQVRMSEGRGAVVDGIRGGSPFHLPVNAQDWFDRLCAVSDRPFTPAELAVLPPGVPAEAPCTD